MVISCALCDNCIFVCLYYKQGYQCNSGIEILNFWKICIYTFTCMNQNSICIWKISGDMDKKQKETSDITFRYHSVNWSFIMLFPSLTVIRSTADMFKFYLRVRLSAGWFWNFILMG
jgi:hypothetical protein